MPPNAPGCRPKENFYETPVDAYHGVGRRDAMITDEDRQALAYFRAHPRGIRADNLSPAQRAHFDDLLARFVERARPGLVGYEMDRINAADGTGELHFAWAGGTTIDQPHYFRIQGPATSSNSTTPKTKPTTSTASGATPPTTGPEDDKSRVDRRVYPEALRSIRCPQSASSPLPSGTGNTVRRRPPQRQQAPPARPAPRDARGLTLR